MKLINKTELKLENFDKCSLICDNDAPLGSLYDFSCALKAFLVEKLNAVEEAQRKQESKEEVKDKSDEHQ